MNHTTASPPRAKAPSANGPMLAIGLWIAVFACLLGSRLGWQAMPALASDTYQYFSVAHNALAGLPGYTSLVHFDAERSFGTIPAPLVTFPMGYPMLLAVFIWLGLTPDQAVVLSNALAIVVCIVAMGYFMKRLQLGPRAIHIVLAALALNATLGKFTSRGIAEAVFMGAITLGGLLLAGNSDQKNATARAALAGVIIGLSYHLRYAGLFVLVGLMGVAALSWLLGRRDRFRQYALAATVAGCIMAAGLLRNILLVGNWRGGNEKVVLHGLGAIAAETVRAFDVLLLGERLNVIENLVHAGFLVIGLLCLGILLRQRWNNLPTRDGTDVTRASVAGQELGLIVLIYSACMFYAGVHTVISYGERMFLPILPMLLVSLACAEMATRARRDSSQNLVHGNKVLQAGLIALCVAYAGVNVNQFAQKIDLTRDRTTHDMLHVEKRDGKTAADIVASLVVGGKSIIANDGQMLGHELNQPTVSMVSLEYSNKEWTEAMVRETATRFKTGAVVIRRPTPKEEGNIDIIPSAFVRQLAHGVYPDWLQPAYSSDRVMVYAVNP